MKPDYERFDELLNSPELLSRSDKKDFRDLLDVSERLKADNDIEIDKIAMARTILDVEKVAKRRRIINDLKRMLRIGGISSGFTGFIKEIASFNPFPKLAYKAIAILLIVIISVSTVSLSTYANPGDLLYPIKIITEKISYYLHFNKEGKLELNITFSKARMKELLKKFEETGRIDKEILNVVLEEAQKALINTDNLEGDKRQIFKDKIKELNTNQYEILTRLDKQAVEDDRAAISNARNHCSRMMEGHHRGKMMRRRLMHR